MISNKIAWVMISIESIRFENCKLSDNIKVIYFRKMVGK